MKVRLKKDHAVTGESHTFNVHALWEMIVGFDDTDDITGDVDSCPIGDFEVFIPAKGWVNMNQAFALRDLIPNNYNTHFGEPHNDEERERGWSP